MVKITDEHQVTENQNRLNEWFNHNVGRHFVSLSCVQQPPGKDENVIVFSGFLAGFEEEWLFITAGHILRDVEKAVADGSTFDVWRLGDDTARGKYQGIAIPFDFNPAEWLAIYNENIGVDYASVVLRPIYRQALEAGGAQPLPRQAWGSHESKHDYWALLGVPSETVSYDAKTIIAAKTKTLVLAPAESPTGPSDKDEYRFYAKLVGDSVTAVDNVDGMSGGPIFAIQAINNIWHYSAIGVQSGWFPSSRILIACPFISFASLLSDVLHSELSDVNNNEDQLS